MMLNTRPPSAKFLGYPLIHEPDHCAIAPSGLGDLPGIDSPSEPIAGPAVPLIVCVNPS